jgi:hypothetical protein
LRRKKRKDALSEETIAVMEQYWLQPEASRASPMERDVILDKNKDKVAKHFLEDSQSAIYKQFKAAHPGHQGRTAEI